MKKIISIAGTLGVGKSTFTKLLAKELRYMAVFENPEKNPFLPLFYKNMKQWAFHSQIHFLIEKAKQCITFSKQKKSIVQDTPIIEDVFSYAKAQNVIENMSSDEWKLYQKTYLLFKPMIQNFNIIIYLEAPISIIYERIYKRNRAYETNNQRKKLIQYITLLNTLNKKWLKKIKEVNPNTKVLIVDTVKEKYLEDDGVMELLVKRIKKL